MAQFKEGLYYSKSHEWVKPEGNLARVGISDFALSPMLGDLCVCRSRRPGRQAW